MFQIVSSEGAGVTVVFQNLTVKGGAASNGGALGGSAALGGGFLIDGGHVTLSSVSVKSNRAGAPGPTNTSAGGGLSAPAGAEGGAGAAAQGGGIYIASGTLTMNDVAVSDNSAYCVDGIAGALGHVSAIHNRNGGAGGAGGTAAGGGLYISGGSGVVVGSKFTSNQVGGGRGGLGGPGGLGDNGGAGGEGGGAAGGAIDLAGGGLTLKTSSLGSNVARRGNGGRGWYGGQRICWADWRGGICGQRNGRGWQWASGRKWSQRQRGEGRG